MPDPNEPVIVTISRAVFELAVYALRHEAHHQSPDEYPDHPPYPPYCDDVRALAIGLRRRRRRDGTAASRGCRRGQLMSWGEETHCRLGDKGDCGGPHADANFTDVTEASADTDSACIGAVVQSMTIDVTGEDGEARIKMYLTWWENELRPEDARAFHHHALELSGDGLDYLAELLARIYGVKLPSDVSDLKRDYYAGDPEQSERARHGLNRRGVPTRPGGRTANHKRPARG